MSARPPSDERLCALIDGELLPGEAGVLLAQARTDPALRQRLADLGLTKTMLRNAYADPPAPPAARPAAPRRLRTLPNPGQMAWRAATLAGLLLAGVGAGWWLHGHQASFMVDRSADRSAGGAAADGLPAQGRSDLVLLHLDSADPARAQGLLDRAEALLATARSAQRPMAVEILANGPGLQLLRDGFSPHAERIARLRSAYPGLSLVACGQTAQRLRETGAVVTLLPGATESSSALDTAVRRMQQGWAYLRV